MALTVTITNAGRAELINAQNTGTNAAVINSIGVSSVHAAGDLKLLTALPNERKRLTTFGGEVVADDVIHATINDTTADTYALRAFGLYFESGTLFAVCSSAEPIMEKAAAAMLLQAVDITLTTLDTASIEFGGTGFINPPATIERMGVVELATAEETLAAADATRAVTPFGLGRVLTAWAASFAAKIHGHVIGDIEGLGLALAGKAAKAHDHDAADTKTGVFHVDRIPKLSIGWINNLTETLADKAQALHSHTMAQVSGLIDALALKANLASPTFSGTAGFVHVVVNAVLSLTAPQNNNRRLFFRTDNVNRWALNANAVPETGNNSGSHFAIERFDDGGAYLDTPLHINRSTGQVSMPQRPAWGATPWDNLNFNPTSKASVGVNVNFRDVSAVRNATDGAFFFGSDGSRWLAYLNGRYELIGLGGLTVNGHRAWTAEHFDAANLVTISATGLGRTGAGAFITFGSPQSYGALPTGFTAMVPPGQPGMPNSGYSYFSKIARRDAADGYAALVVTHTASAGDKPEAWFGGSHSANEWPSWAKVWTDQNFNPADRAPALHSHDWAQVTGKPPLATTDGTGVSFGSWNFGVAVRVNGSDWRYLPNDARVEEIINWRAANNAETLAGALTHKFVSPASLWSFARAIGPNGYQQIPGTDLIVQWGVSNGSHPEGAVHAVLPVAFGGGCLFACATPRNASQAYGMDFVMQIVGRYLDRIVFYANRGNSNAGNMSGYEWMAVGLARGNPDPVYSTGYPPGGGGGGGGEDPFIRPEV